MGLIDFGLDRTVFKIACATYIIEFDHTRQCNVLDFIKKYDKTRASHIIQ